jgi:hypothetical protein
MTAQNNATPLSSAARLATADRLVKDGERLQSQYMKNEKLSKRQHLRLIVRAYFTFTQAIALFEAAGDLTDCAFRQKLARVYIICSYCAGRYAYMCRTGERELPGAEALHISLYKKAVELDGQTLADLEGDEFLHALWAQILHMHNLTLFLSKVGSFTEAESFTLEGIDLQKEFARENDEGRLDHRVWLPAHYQLATIAIALNHSTESVLAVINSGLAAFNPAELRSAYGLEFFAKLCALKSEVMEKSESQSETAQES